MPINTSLSRHNDLKTRFFSFQVQDAASSKMTGILEPKLASIFHDLAQDMLINLTLAVGLDRESRLPKLDDMGPNITAQWDDHCFRFKFIFYCVVIGIICLLGMVGNTISLLVLRMDRSNNVALFLLQALSVADNLVLFISFLILSVFFGLLPMVVSSRLAHNISLYGLKYLEPCAYMSHTATIWMTVLLAINRYVAVCMPFRASNILTFGKTRLQVAAVFLFSVLFNIPRFFQWNLTHEVDPETNATTVRVAKSSIGHGTLFGKIYTNAMYSILVVLLPLIFLIVLNVKLIKEINLMRQRRSSLTHGSPNKEENVTTIMIVIIVVVIVGHLPDRILQIVRTLTKTSFRDCSASPFYFVALANLLIIMNSSTNFLVYYILRKSFRKILMVKLCRRKPRADYRSPSSVTCTQDEIKMLSACTDKSRISLWLTGVALL